MTEQSIDEVDKILGKMTVMPYDEGYQEAKTALNQYYLSVFMDITEPYYKAAFNAHQPNVQYQVLARLRAEIKEKLQ